MPTQKNPPLSSNPLLAALDDWNEPEISDPLDKSVIRVALLVWVSFCAAPFLSSLLGLSRLTAGVRMAVPGYGLRTLGLFLLFGGFVHLFFIWPFAEFVYPTLKAKWSRFPRLVAATCLLSSPLFAGLYYLGHVGSSTDLLEIYFASFLPVVMGVVLFEETGRVWIFSAFVILTSFFHTFIVNDVLGAYFTLWNYETVSPLAYALRAGLPSFTLGAALIWFSVKNASPRYALFAALSLILYGLVLLVAMRLVVPSEPVNYLEWGWMLAALLLAAESSPRVKKWSWVVWGGGVLALALQLATAQLSFEYLLRIHYIAVVMGTVGGYLIFSPPNK